MQINGIQFSPADFESADRSATGSTEGVEGKGNSVSPGRTEDSPVTTELSDEEKRKVQELQKRDREVRAHEQAHLAAAGQYAKGGANFSYVAGPDGQQYAVGGEVQIDTSEVSGDPEATARKMEQIRRAALAPSQPSGQDMRVAAEATQKGAEARVEASVEQNETSQSGLSQEAAANRFAEASEQTTPGKLFEFVL